MSNKFMFLIALILAVIIVLEPWLLLGLEPAVIYLFNILASLVFIHMIITLLKKLKNEGTKKEIVSLTAHQLASPLVSIKWALLMLLNNNFGKIEEEQRKVIAGIFKKNYQLIYLVEDLLDTAKIEDGKYLLEKELDDLENIVLSAVDFYKDEIQKRKINFNFLRPAKKLPEIRMDGQKIKLAVQNLFDNAIKYTPPGGQIVVTLVERGKNAEFKIQDSGMGIGKKQKNKIFNKFFRGNNAIKKEPMGYGLGLFFVKSIIEAHGGRIWFKSKENQGSSFYFTLPIKRQLHKIL